ncbi:hypothetical protein AURDEDRAFT_170352 [Auricularia subglabra TFB-10046 SS5]|nr:hypothetical protein AURDEDRAFT_170352 [Auricularia subglabra TFB-10046 SS5]
MDPPVAVVFDMEYEVDLARLPEHLNLATTLATSVLTMYASAYSDNDGSWMLDSVGAVTQYLALPFPNLKGLRVDIGFTESLQESVLADMLRPGWAHLQRLTLKLYESPALAVEDLFVALHGTPRLISLSLECADWRDSSPDMDNLRAPPLLLQSFTTENIFPGCDLLLHNSRDTLRTLVIGDPTLLEGNNYFDTAEGPTKLPHLQNLVIELLPPSDISCITTACSRLENLQVLHCPSSARTTEASLVPALEALENPLKHLVLPYTIQRWQHSLPRLVDIIERADSPLRQLRMLCFSDDAHRLSRTTLSASPLSQHLASRRIQQRVITSWESSSLLPRDGL